MFRTQNWAPFYDIIEFLSSFDWTSICTFAYFSNWEQELICAEIHDARINADSIIIFKKKIKSVLTFPIASNALSRNRIMPRPMKVTPNRVRPTPISKNIF
jgi:hypothetical protein